MELDVRRRMARLGLNLPGGEAPKFRCRVCADRGIETRLYEREYVAHVVTCAKEHEAELREKHDQSDIEGIVKPFDPEFAAWGHTPTGKRWWNRVREGRPGPVVPNRSAKRGSES